MFAELQSYGALVRFKKSRVSMQSIPLILLSYRKMQSGSSRQGDWHHCEWKGLDLVCHKYSHLLWLFVYIQNQCGWGWGLSVMVVQVWNPERPQFEASMCRKCYPITWFRQWETCPVSRCFQVFIGCHGLSYAFNMNGLNGTFSSAPTSCRICTMILVKDD